MGRIKESVRRKRFKTVIVPDLYGLTAAEASEAGGNAGVIVKSSDPTAPPLALREGRVTAQHPAAGSVARFGSQVVVVMSGPGGSRRRA